MYITWLGLSCIKLQGDNATVVCNPINKDSGLKAPRFSADIVTLSNESYLTNVENIKGISAERPFIISSAGEYEIKDAFIYGIFCQHEKDENKIDCKNTIYRIEIDGMTVVHLGDLSHPFSNGQLENLKTVDILILPVGGGQVIDGKQAFILANQIEPRLVIPVYYKTPGLKIKVDGLDKFCHEAGVCPTETVSKYKIAKKDLPAEDMKIVVLSLV